MIRTGLSLLYEGRDITRDIAPYLVQFQYADYAHGQTDDLQIRVEDRQRLWQGGWYPSKGAKLTASIRSAHGDRFSLLSCGVFEIDEIEISGPPDEVLVKATAAAVTSALRREKRTRAWQSTSLEAIARQVAGEHGLSCYYSGARFGFVRVDQREESDLGFLQRLCEENGINLKVKDEKVILFAGKETEEMPVVRAVRRGDGSVRMFGFTDKAHDVYRAATVAYTDPETKSEKRYTYVPPGAPPTGHELKINRRVESLAAAMRRAQTELRRQNKSECTASLELMGDPGMRAGLNISLDGWGRFDGTYCIDSAMHTCGPSGYTTSLSLHRVMGF